MALIEHSGLMKHKDTDGNVYLLYPITTKENVDGLENIDAHLEDTTIHVTSAEKAAWNSKAEGSHTHTIANVTGLQNELDGKAASSHGTHVSYSTATPSMDGTASAGSAATVARSDHKHPTDTSRAAKTDFDNHTADTTKHITSTERTNWGSAYTHSQDAHAPSDAEKNQNAFSNVKVGDTTVAADTATDTLTLVAGSNVTITTDATNDKITISSTDTNTTYSAGTGLSLSGTTFSNSGVRSIGTGSSNGTVSVNTGGTTADVKVKGLGSAAYTDSTSYDAAGAANTALASAKTYADNAATAVKNDLLNGAGEAYDTLKELSDLIVDNQDAIDALETVASGKADKNHTHTITNVTGLQSVLDGKAASSHTHTVANISDLTATATELNYMDGVTSNVQTQLNGKAASSHTHTIANVTNLQTTLDGKAPSSHTHDSTYGVTTAGTGSAYTATVDGITSLTAGIGFVMIPHTVSTVTNPTLNVNGLGAKYIRRPISGSFSMSTVGDSADWIASGKPVRLTYNGTFWIVDNFKPNVNDLYGTLPITNGGTGATTAEQARLNLGITTSDGTNKSQNADYAEVGEWADGNANDEDRIGYFVSVDTSSDGTTIVKATSTADVRGVTVTAPAFSGNCSDDKFDDSGNLLHQYDYVAVMGFVSVIDNGTCTINGHCMPADDGTAIPSVNNLGYQVIDRIDSTHVLIAVEPGADMIQRIKTDINSLQSSLVAITLERIDEICGTTIYSGDEVLL